MPNWEHIEDASPEASRVWLARVKDKDHEPWKPLRKTDCQALNESIAAVGNDGDVPPSVYIEGGRATADPSQRLIRYNFFRGEERELCSAIWFRKEERSKHEVILHPIVNADDSEKIEGLYKKAVTASSSLGKGISSVLPEEVTLEDGSKVIILLVGGSLRLIVKNKGWFASQYDLQRGYGEYTVEGEENEMLLSSVKHLVFVVHGIGEALFSREEVKVSSITEQTNAVRITCQRKQVEAWRDQCRKATKAGLPEPPPPNRMELIPIEWFNHLHDSSTSLMKSLKSSTLQTIPALRAIANDVIFDVLMYMTPAFCYSTLECVTEQINEHYQTFQRIHPDFANNGKTSLIGHSLGSVIVWDLLSILKDKQTGTTKKQSHSPRGVSIASQDSFEVGYQAYAREEGADKDARHGTWGPSLTKRLEQTIPFVPECTILLGSPCGIFLTLRGAHAVFNEYLQEAIEETRQKASAGKTSLEETVEVPVASPFTLPTASLYNIFHPSDPVAYRIEPLLLSQDLDPNDLPPPAYFTAPGKEVRLHLKAKQITDEIKKNLQEQKNAWSAFLDSTLTALSTTATEPAANKRVGHQELLPGPNKYPLGGRSPRVDFSLQPGVIDNEYISAVTAHSSYFTNPDLQDFLISLMTSDRADESTVLPLQDEVIAL